MFNLKMLLSGLHSRKLSKILILLRHAEKHITGDVLIDAAAGITPDGYQEAINVGQRFMTLDFPVAKIFSSPISRCVSTAKGIWAGLGEHDRPINQTNLLGDPGPYVADDKLAVKHFLTKPLTQIAQEHLRGEKLAGMHPVEHGRNILLQQIAIDLAESEGPIIYLTHDIILATFFCSLVNEYELSEHNWIGYLQGFTIGVDEQHNAFLINAEAECNITDFLRPYMTTRPWLGSR